VRDAAADGGGAFLASADKDSAINAAVAIYSRHRPQETSTQVAGDGGYIYAMPASWVDGFSVIRTIESPTGNQIPTYVEPDRWTIYRDPAGLRVRFYDLTPPASDNIRYVYTIPHAVSAGASSVPASDDHAIAAKASAILLRQLGARHARDFDSTLTADAVDHAGTATRYDSLATALEDEFDAHLGIGDSSDDTVAAMVLHDIDVDMAWGERRLFHGPRVT
jgi:hypothetical protein